MLVHSARSRSNPLLAALVVLLSLGCLAALVTPASAGPRVASTTPRLSATAPTVTLNGGSASFVYSVASTRKTTVKALHLRVRPASTGADVGKDTGALSNVTVSGTRPLT